MAPPGWAAAETALIQGCKGRGPSAGEALLVHQWCTGGRSESGGERRCARRGRGGSPFSREFELTAHSVRHDEHR